jgi:hypothetical protein
MVGSSAVALSPPCDRAEVIGQEAHAETPDHGVALDPEGGASCIRARQRYRFLASGYQGANLPLETRHPPEAKVPFSYSPPALRPVRTTEERGCEVSQHTFCAGLTIMCWRMITFAVEPSSG